MPKDRAEVQDQYKIGGGSLNEYEYEQSKGEYEEQTHQAPDDAPVEGLRGAAEPGLPENVAERIRRVEERAHEVVERRRAKQGGGAQKGAAKAASKKGGAKGAAKKVGAAKKAGGAKGAAKKGAAKKSAAKKSAAGKGGAKSAAGKGGAKKGAAKKGGSRR
jgi:hypothetical protein